MAKTWKIVDDNIFRNDILIAGIRKMTPTEKKKVPYGDHRKTFYCWYGVCFKMRNDWGGTYYAKDHKQTKEDVYQSILEAVKYFYNYNSKMPKLTLTYVSGRKVNIW